MNSTSDHNRDGQQTVLSGTKDEYHDVMDYSGVEMSFRKPVKQRVPTAPGTAFPR